MTCSEIFAKLIAKTDYYLLQAKFSGKTAVSDYYVMKNDKKFPQSRQKFETITDETSNFF